LRTTFRSFHHLDVPRRRILDEAAGPAVLLPRAEDKNPAIVEMVAYAGIFITAFVIMASATYFISMQLGGFALSSADRHRAGRTRGRGHQSIGCKRIKTILVAAVPHLAGNPPAAGGRESGGNNSHGRSS
jgi:hypothetical protein